jgi:hypothetical protein
MADDTVAAEDSKARMVNNQCHECPKKEEHYQIAETEQVQARCSFSRTTPLPLFLAVALCTSPR